jgi:hypothetical protein
MPLVEGCLDQVRYLDDRLDLLLPTRNDNGWEKTVKDLKSVYQNKGIQESVAELHKHILLLVFHQATSAADYGQKAAAQEQLSKTCQTSVGAESKPQKKGANNPNELPTQVRL